MRERATWLYERGPQCSTGFSISGPHNTQPTGVETNKLKSRVLGISSFIRKCCANPGPLTPFRLAAVTGLESSEIKWPLNAPTTSVQAMRAGPLNEPPPAGALKKVAAYPRYRPVRSPRGGYRRGQDRQRRLGWKNTDPGCSRVLWTGAVPGYGGVDEVGLNLRLTFLPVNLTLR